MVRILPVALALDIGAGRPKAQMVLPSPGMAREEIRGIGGVHIKNQMLAIEFGDRVGFVRAVGGNKAIVTVSFTVVLDDDDMNLPGGFKETVYLTPEPPGVFAVGGTKQQLWLNKAVAQSSSNPLWELKRERTFHVPRYPYPAEPFTTTRFHASIEIWPDLPRHAIKDTNEGVLPAKYPVSPSSALSEVGKIVRRLRGYMFDR